MNLSENYTLEQLTKSQTATRKGITEQFNPPSEVVEKLKDVCINIVERLLLIFPDLTISSGYRSPALNTAIGGANTSQHTKGEAVDLQITKASNINIARAVISAKFNFDQMIIEGGTLKNPDWVHISYKRFSNRGEILRADFTTGHAVYTKLTKEQILEL